MTSSITPPPPQLPADLVPGIMRQDPEAIQEFYKRFSNGIRFVLQRNIRPEDVDDRLQDVFLTAIQAIARGDLRDPSCLVGFIYGIVRNYIRGYIHHAVQCRERDAGIPSEDLLLDDSVDPEAALIERENQTMAMRVLESLAPKERAVLRLFYLEEMSPREICARLGFTETQFRLIKSRAKARFGERGRQVLARQSRLGGWLQTRMQPGRAGRHPNPEIVESA